MKRTTGKNQPLVLDEGKTTFSVVSEREQHRTQTELFDDR